MKSNFTCNGQVVLSSGIVVDSCTWSNRFESYPAHRIILTEVDFFSPSKKMPEMAPIKLWLHPTKSFPVHHPWLIIPYTVEQSSYWEPQT
jgi:hypothetical protein